MNNDEPPRKKASNFEYERIAGDSIEKIYKELKDKIIEGVTFEKIINANTRQWTGKVRCSDEDCTFREFNAFELQFPNKLKTGNGK